MNCPNCQTLCNDSDNFCYLCGTPLQPCIPPKPKKGSRWVPILLLILMSAVGLLLFFTTANRPPIRAAGSSDWFYMHGGVLYFDESRYTGGSELTIPNKIDGQIVYTISDDCFANVSELTSVILPDTLTRIGDGAFYGCTSLRGISVPASVNSIGAEAFHNCTALEAVNLPGSLSVIDRNAFDECSSLRFIFYDGMHDEWTSLYDEFINPYVGVICSDGSFYQGGNLYE